MKSKSFEMAVLFDFYGDMLTDKQKEFFDLYYNEDLSLGEIGENEGITRQGVRDAVRRAEDTLREMEQKLGMVARYGKLDAQLAQITELAETIAQVNERGFSNADIERCTQEILEITGQYADRAQAAPAAAF